MTLTSYADKKISFEKLEKSGYFEGSVLAIATNLLFKYIYNSSKFEKMEGYEIGFFV